MSAERQFFPARSSFFVSLAKKFPQKPQKAPRKVRCSEASRNAPPFFMPRRVRCATIKHCSSKQLSTVSLIYLCFNWRNSCASPPSESQCIVTQLPASVGSCFLSCKLASDWLSGRATVVPPAGAGLVRANCKPEVGENSSHLQISRAQEEGKKGANLAAGSAQYFRAKFD